ncbi:MAG TPA: YcxB family protein [Caulobacteraceae bacterium]|jgi:hypothetical protein
MVVSGKLRRGDAPGEWQVHRRILGRRAGAVAMLTGAFLLLAAYLPWAAAVAAGWPSQEQGPLALVGTVAALIVYLTMAYQNAWRVASVAKAVIGRGAGASVQQVSYAVGDALRTEASGTTSEVQWRMVTEVFPFKDGWVLLIGSRAYPVPFRFFADVEAQRPFVRAVLERVTPEARERSAEAREFVLWS